MNTPYTLADVAIVVALTAAFVAWLYLRHRERQQRMEIVHQERLVAMDKGIPLPELPSEPPKASSDPRAILVHGVAWIALGLGGIGALLFMGTRVNGIMLWPLPLPLLLLGVGLILLYVLVHRPR